MGCTGGKKRDPEGQKTCDTLGVISFSKIGNRTCCFSCAMIPEMLQKEKGRNKYTYPIGLPPPCKRSIVYIIAASVCKWNELISHDSDKQSPRYEGFHKWGYPQIIHFKRILRYESSIWGTTIYGNPNMLPGGFSAQAAGAATFQPFFVTIIRFQSVEVVIVSCS